MGNKLAILVDAVAFGAPGTYSGEYSGPRKEIVMYFSAAVSDGDVVVVTTDTTYGLGGSAGKSAATTDLATVIGFADEDVAAGAFGRIVVHGVKLGVPGMGAIAAGAAVCTDNTAGKIRSCIAANLNRLGFALEATTGDGDVKLFVKCS
jgi:hypothetical protein